MKRNLGLGVVMVVALALGACGGGSSDGGSSAGSSTEAFCKALLAAELTDGAAEPTVAEMRALAAEAPDSIRGDVDTVVDAIEALSGVDESDSEAFAAAFAIVLSPEFVEAGARLEAFGVDECGLKPTENGGSDNASDASGDMSSEASGELADPLYDPSFDDPIDPTVASFEGAQSFIDQNYPTAPWRTRLGSWSLSGDSAAREFGAGGVDITAAEAVEVCTAIADYLRPLHPAGTIIISTYEHFDDGTFGAESEVLAGGVASGC